MSAILLAITVEYKQKKSNKLKYETSDAGKRKAYKSVVKN
jgi:hypothetical protein